MISRRALAASTLVLGLALSACTPPTHVDSDKKVETATSAKVVHPQETTTTSTETTEPVEVTAVPEVVETEAVVETEVVVVTEEAPVETEAPAH